MEKIPTGKIVRSGVSDEVSEKPAEPKNFELKLEEVAKSSKKINEIADSYGHPKSKEVSLIKPWGDYTIVGLKGYNRLGIYDEKAELLKSFDEKCELSVRDISWASILQRGNPDKEYLGSHSDSRVLPFSKVGVFLRAILDDYRNSTAERFSDISRRMGTQKLLGENYKLMDFEGGKYILCIDPATKVFIGYITENEKGIRLAPKDWIKIDFTSDSSKLPADFVAHIEKTIKQTDDYRELNSKYNAIVTDVGINIIDVKNPDGAPVFKDAVPSVVSNIAVDPSNPDVVYYCSSGSPKEITRLDMTGDPTKWQTRSAEIPGSYKEVKNLQLDPTGAYFLLYTEDNLVMLAKETLEEIKRVPGLKEVNFDSQGRVRAVDKNGYLVTYRVDTTGLAEMQEKKRIERLTSGVDATELFKVDAIKTKGAKTSLENQKDLLPIKEKMEREVTPVIQSLENLEHATNFRKQLGELRKQLRGQGLTNDEVDFVTGGIEVLVKEKEKLFVTKETTPILDSIEKNLGSGLSLSSAVTLRGEIDRLKASELLMDDVVRNRYHTLGTEFNVKYQELFQREGSKVVADVRGLLSGIRTQLDAINSKNNFDDWMEFRLPQFKSRLGEMLRECPIEADEAYKAISGARTELQEMAVTYQQKFEQEYAKVREKAVGRIDAVVTDVQADIASIVKRLQDKNFKDRADAEVYLSSSEAKKVLEQEIRALAKDQPDIAVELERALKVQISNSLSAIERGAKVNVSETGQQMALFGKTLFPKWEAKVKEKKERSVGLTFQTDARSQGPGIKPAQMQGDVEFVVTKGDGKKEKMTPFAGWVDEEEWRLGLFTSRGVEIPPSYMTADEFKEVKKQYGAWEEGTLKKQYEAKRRELADIYLTREKIGKRTDEKDSVWQSLYRAKLNDYAKFCAENHIALFRRADSVKEGEEENGNGKGFVPTWQSHWVVDPDTEKNLERMAETFKMQLELKEGVLNLNGHAGTGKDVLMKMFCNRTGRPYFATDCTKWTTEYELSEDVVLEAKDGATQTIKVPSAVLNGIQTPGALVYFNEVNGMPEQAQIFLHALWDEKRSLTLKTSSGKVIKAHPSVLFASSMNPGYPGTFNPQFATKSRMVSLEIDYPSLYTEAGPNDKNPNKPINSSEALRIAREVDSLSDLTFEPNMERNEFVQLWDSYVNGIKNGSSKPSPVQEFDIKAILALVEFGNKLRENFVLNFEKSRDARNALPVHQPLTSRELRRAAYSLSKMPIEEKTKGNADAVARKLLEKFFLSHVDNSEHRDKIKTAMATWRSQKRVAA